MIKALVLPSASIFFVATAMVMRSAIQRLPDCEICERPVKNHFFCSAFGIAKKHGFGTDANSVLVIDFDIAISIHFAGVLVEVLGVRKNKNRIIICCCCAGMRSGCCRAGCSGAIWFLADCLFVLAGVAAAIWFLLDHS